MSASTSADRVLTIYKASAGSGKTYALTFEYIRDLLTVKNPETGTYRLNLKRNPSGGEIANRHRGILAITFTNKATEEMKKRIISRLHDLTSIPARGQKDADYAADLMKLTGCSRTDLALSARAALEQLLYDFHNFNVSTIDSFFQRVLRSFARELDRQGDFEIELNSRAAMNAAVENMLDDFNISAPGQTPLEDWLERYMRNALNSGEKADLLNRNSNAHRTMVSLIALISSEKFSRFEKGMKEYLLKTDRLSRLLGAVDRRITALKDQSSDLAREILAELSAYPSNGKFNNYASAFAEKIASKKDIDIKTLIGYGNGDKKIFNANPTCPPETAERTVADIARCAGLRLRAEELAIIRKSLHTLKFLSFAWNYLHRYFSDNNIVLLSNTNTLIHRIIDGSDVPFIYERMGVRLHNFLIDEFQDTSKMQWSNLKSLVANSIAEHHDNLIIGDVKQSIYRFRNSEPDLLHEQVENRDFPEYCRLRGDRPSENTNHRSSIDVVAFNNTFFLRLASILAVKGYEQVVQAVPEKHRDFRGYVHFLPCVKPKSGKEGDDGEEQLTDEQKIIRKFPQLPLLADQIRRQRQEGGYRFKDIAILCSKRSECATAIEYLLKYHPDIPILTSESLYLTNSNAVKLIIGMLRLISNVQSARTNSGDVGHEYASLADMNLAVSRFEYFISDPEVNGDPEEALSRALDSRETVEEAVGAILDTRPASLQALVDSIISQRIPQKMRAEQLPYILALQDYVAEYSEHGLQSVNSFLHWWDEQSSEFSIPLGSDIDAVTVLTIHRSKGLEFPCVHLPFASWPLTTARYQSANLWIEMPELEGIDPELLPPAILTGINRTAGWKEGLFHNIYEEYIKNGEIDTVNLTYVAYTRAEAELIAYYDPGAEIGVKIAECFRRPYADDERNIEFTVDLARHFNPETGEFILGEPTKREDLPSEKRRKEEARKDKADGSRKEPAPYYPAYDVFRRSDAQVITSVDSLLDPDNDIEDNPGKTDIYRARRTESPQERYGNMMHDILSNTRRITDLDSAVALVAAAKRYSAEEVKAGGETLRTVLNMNREELARWFRDFDRVLCEQSIYIARADRPIYRRPDRLVFQADGSVEVVDFKFTAAEETSHITQVQEYMSLMRDMGYEVKGGWLWYPLLPGAPAVKC